MNNIQCWGEGGEMDICVPCCRVCELITIFRNVIWQYLLNEKYIDDLFWGFTCIKAKVYDSIYNGKKL